MFSNVPYILPLKMDIEYIVFVVTNIYVFFDARDDGTVLKRILVEENIKNRRRRLTDICSY